MLAGLWLAGLASFFQVQAQIISLELKTGERIVGRVLSESTNRVVLSNAWARELNIPVAEIVKRTPLPPVNNLVAATNGTQPVATVAPTALAQTKTNSSFFTAPALKNWHGDLLVGTDLTFSERNRQVYNAKAKLIYAKDRFKGVLEYDATYGRSQVEETELVNGQPTTHQTSQTDANRMNGILKTDYDLTKKSYLYNLGSIGYDEVRKIDLRYEIGPGLGYHLVQRANFFLNTEAGASYQKEERSDGTEVGNFFFRLAQNAAWKITPRLSWDEKMEYMPRVTDVTEYRMRFESNLRYTLVQNIFVNLSVIDIYDSMPATGVTQNDLQFRSSVGVKF